MFKVLTFQPSEYAMCSLTTQKQAEAYETARMKWVKDKRRYNYYPLLDRLNDWIDSTYAS